MIDPTGAEWLPVAEAARAVRVRESTIYGWTSRGLVAAHRRRGRSTVYMPDVMRCELAWRKRCEEARTKRLARMGDLPTAA